jgi:hypothetical protein
MKVTEEERQKIHEELKESFEYTFDMDNMKPQEHFFVDRGQVLSCEGATHPNHRVFKKLK